MRRFLFVLFLMLFSLPVFSKTATVDYKSEYNNYDFNKAYNNEQVSNIKLKLPKYSTKITPIVYILDSNSNKLSRKLSISGTASPFIVDFDSNVKSIFYLIAKSFIILEDGYKLSLKNLDITNYNGGYTFIYNYPIIRVRENGKLSLNNVCFQTNSKYESSMIENEGTLDIKSAYFFNEGTGVDVTNTGTMNLNSGKVYLQKGIDGDGRLNIKGAKVQLSPAGKLEQESVKISKGSLEVNPSNLKLNSLVNNVKNGLIFSNNETEVRTVKEEKAIYDKRGKVIGSEEVDVTKSFSTKSSASEKVTLKDTTITGKGSVKIMAHVLLDKTSTISQNITIVPMLKEVVETVPFQNYGFATSYDKTDDYFQLDFENYNYTFLPEASSSSIIIRINGQQYMGDSEDFIPLINKYLLKHPDEPIVVKVVSGYVHSFYNGQMTELENVQYYSGTSLTASADSIKGVVTNKSELYLTDGTLTKQIKGDGNTHITGDVESNAKITQEYLVIDPEASLTVNASNLAKKMDVDNTGTLKLTEGILNVVLTGGGTVLIDGVVGNKSKISANPLHILEGSCFVTDASMLKWYVFNDDNQWIVNEGALQLASGTLSSVKHISNNGKNEAYDLTEGVVEIVGKVKIDSGSGIKFVVNEDTNEEELVKETFLPTIYQITNISKKGTLTTNADALKGNVGNLGTLNLTGGTLEIDKSAGIQYDLQNENTVNISNVVIKSDIDNYGKLTIKNSSIGNVEVTDSALIENYKTTTLSVDNEVKNVVGLAILNEYNSSLKKTVPTLTVSGKVSFKDNNNETGLGGVIYNHSSNSSYKPKLVLKGSSTYYIPDSEFVGNKAKNGGAIANEGGTITVNEYSFTKNIAGNYGGAIYNKLGDLTIKTSILNDNNAIEGGAIYNKGTTTIKNSTLNKNIAEKGGAIYNDVSGCLTLDNCTIGNYSYHFYYHIMSVGSSYRPWGYYEELPNIAQYGAGLYNCGKSTISNTSFLYNKAQVEGNYSANGGAIYNYFGELNVKSSDFHLNSADNGGAIFNASNKLLKVSKSDFSGNSATNYGGAIYNNNIINITNSEFLKNTATENGGDIYNSGTMNISKTYFGAYKPTKSKGAFYIYMPIISVGPTYDTIYEDKITTNNVVDGWITPELPEKFPIEPVEQPSNYDIWGANAKQGGAIYNTGDLVVDSSYFYYAFAKEGGAIYNEQAGTLEVKNTSFIGNKSEKGGAIYFAQNSINNTILTSTFKENIADKGGALYLASNSEVYVQDTSFTDNIATVAGGAIYLDNNSKLYLMALKKNVTISGNVSGEDTSDGIYLTEGSSLYFGIAKNKTITIKDAVKIDDNAERATITIEKYGKGTLKLLCEYDFSGTKCNLNGEGTLDIANGKISDLFISSLSLPASSINNVCLDADLQKATSDKIQAETVEGTGVLNVSGVNVVTNSKTPVEIKVGEDSIVSSMTATKAESAEATYKLKSYYDENGLLRAVVYGQKAKPATVASPVATQLGGYLTQINSYDQAFMNMDLNMVFPRDARELSGKLKVENGKCCHSELDSESQISYNAKGLWNRPYATFERVNLNNGPKVSNVGYGNFFGGDADVKQLRNGWKRQFSAYVGYNGSVQDYDRQSIDQNGGTVGITEVWYKNNFFSGLTVNAGANIAQAHTDLGRENIPMFMTGIASKTGYNFEFNRGKFIVQPSFLMSYSFIHTFEHENGKGSHVGSSPLNAIQVVPSIKFIANLKNGWQPYFNVNMRWNIIDKTYFSLRDVGIPEMSIDPYVEYGIGLQRRWGERFTGYGQAMIRNGGRNGVMLSFGFKWLL